MRNRHLIAVVGAASFAFGIAACVGDPTTPTTDAGVTPDSSTNKDTGTTQDATGTDVSVPTDASDAAVICSEPVVGLSFVTPTTASNAAFAVQSVGPLLAGDYKLTAMGYFTSICFPGPCPSPKVGNAFGGLRITSAGGGNFVIERHVELQQTTKQVLLDKSTGTYDQINRNITGVTRVCTVGDASVVDGGSVWKAQVEVVDGSATGRVFLELPDLPIQQVFADGGNGSNASATGTFVKQ